MNYAEIITALLMLAITIVVGIIGFFLRRTIGEVDKNTSDIEEIKNNYVKKEELNAFREDLRRLSENVDDIKDNYIKKDDFVRAMADTNSRLQKIYDFLLDINGGRRNG